MNPNQVQTKNDFAGYKAKKLMFYSNWIILVPWRQRQQTFWNVVYTALHTRKQEDTKVHCLVIPPGLKEMCLETYFILMFLIMWVHIQEIKAKQE
jgi:hypothetical protein